MTMVVLEKHIQFRNKSRLVGNLTLPKRKNPPAVVIAHGFTGYKDEYPLVHLARTLAKNGIAGLRFDFRGTDQSDGEFVDMTAASEVSDVRAAIAYLSEQRIDQSRIGLVGHSMGGFISILANDKRVKALALWAPAVHLYKNLKDEFGLKVVQEIDKKGCALLPKGDFGYGWRVGKKFWREVRDLGDISERIKKVTIPTLILSGDKDSVVPVKYARNLYRVASQPKQLVIIKNADHDFIGYEDELVGKTTSFLKTHL